VIVDYILFSDFYFVYFVFNLLIDLVLLFSLLLNFLIDLI